MHASSLVLCCSPKVSGSATRRLPVPSCASSTISFSLSCSSFSYAHSCGPSSSCLPLAPPPAGAGDANDVFRTREEDEGAEGGEESIAARALVLSDESLDATRTTIVQLEQLVEALHCVLESGAAAYPFHTKVSARRVRALLFAAHPHPGCAYLSHAYYHMHRDNNSRASSFPAFSPLFAKRSRRSPPWRTQPSLRMTQLGEEPRHRRRRPQQRRRRRH